MHGRRFRDEKEVREQLKPKEEVVVNLGKNGLECYGKPSINSHDIECLMAGARAKNLAPFIIKR